MVSKVSLPRKFNGLSTDIAGLRQALRDEEPE
jgi:hypothetical protein